MEVKAKQICQTKGHYIKGKSIKPSFNRWFKRWNRCSSQSFNWTRSVWLLCECYPAYVAFKKSFPAVEPETSEKWSVKVLKRHRNSWLLHLIRRGKQNGANDKSWFICTVTKSAGNLFSGNPSNETCCRSLLQYNVHTLLPQCAWL